MGRGDDAAALVLCAELPRVAARTAGVALSRKLAEIAGPVTWAADVDTLAGVADAARGAAPDLAIAIAPDWLDSRATLRRMVAAARQAAPGLDTAVLRGGRPLAHHALLAEEGIRAVVVEAVGDAVRGSRRPAPGGWRCRNPVWGLWELQVDPPRRQGLVGWLTGGDLPRPRAGGLHVLHAGDVAVDRPVSGRLGRWLAWAARRAAGGRLRLARPGDVATLLARGGQAVVTGSVLKAA
jgi:hypothetical protein